MKKSFKKGAASVIEGADGPTSVFIVGKNARLTLKQKMQRFSHRIKRFCVEKTLTCENHSMDQVMEYIVNRYGFVEVPGASEELAEEYSQLRASFIIQYAPELLAEYAVSPPLESESPEAVKAYMRQCEEQIQKAREIPPAVFSIDFHKFIKPLEEINDSMELVIKKKYAYIGGGAVGNQKLIRKFKHIYKEIYRYYGVTKEDIKSKSKRYRAVVKTLSQ